MAIAPSKLGRLVATYWHSADAIIRELRAKGLIRPDVGDQEVIATVVHARDEHAKLDEGTREFNSPNERVRVFLAPYLTAEGRRWAVPLDSLKLPD